MGGNILENKWLQRLGELSFIIFLTHKLIITYSSFFYFKLLHFNNIIIFVVSTIVLTVLVSVVVERYFLNPFTQWLTKKIQPSLTARL